MNLTNQKQNRFKDYIDHHPDLLRFNQESVPRGAAVGLFVAIIPIIPFQTLLTILLAILFRANLPTSIAFCWANNPLTFFPIIYASYFLGNVLLGAKESNLTFYSMSHIWTNFGHFMLHFGKAFLLGMPILAFCTGLVGYLTVKLIWHLGVFFKQNNRIK